VNILLSGVEARHPAAAPHAAPALINLNLQVAAGEQVAFIGPSGAGKTTLLHLIGCVQPPAQGTVQLDDQNPWSASVSRLRALRGCLFLAPQVPPLPPRQRVVTSVLAGRLPGMGLWASLRSLFYPTDIPAAHHALRHFDLADKLFERVDRLSGGERQRVGLARTLLAPASLWLIDEPLSALDPSRANMAITALVELARDRQTTLVVTLHQVDMALAHFSRIVGLRDGQVAFDLPTAQVSPERLARLYEQHEHELRGEYSLSKAHLDERPEPVEPALMHCR